MTFTSCGMGWQNFTKDVGSDLGGGLVRTIVVENLYTGEVKWTYSGKAYIKDGSSPGDVTIIYRNSDGDLKKYDVIGQWYGVTSNEK